MVASSIFKHAQTCLKKTLGPFSSTLFEPSQLLAMYWLLCVKGGLRWTDNQTCDRLTEMLFDVDMQAIHTRNTHKIEEKNKQLHAVH